MKTIYKIDWFFIGTEEELENDVENVVQNCTAICIPSFNNSNQTVLIVYEGSRNELAQRLIDIDYYDEDEANEFKQYMREVST